MIMYHGTYKSIPNLSYGTALTSSFIDALAWAKLKCDKEGVPVTDARVYKVSVHSSENWRLQYRDKGVKHMSARYTHIKGEMDYNDLRQKCTQEEWNILHASTSYLNGFVDHTSLSHR